MTLEASSCDEDFALFAPHPHEQLDAVLWNNEHEQEKDRTMQEVILTAINVKRIA